MEVNIYAPKFGDMFPDIDTFLYAPLLCNPPMCALSDLQDGTYSIDDLHLMNEVIEVKELMK